MLNRNNPFLIKPYSTLTGFDNWNVIEVILRRSSLTFTVPIQRLFCDESIRFKVNIAIQWCNRFFNFLDDLTNHEASAGAFHQNLLGGLGSSLECR